MKFDRYMKEGLQEMTQDITPDPMLRARVMNSIQTERTKSRPRRMRFVLAAAAMVCVLATGALAAGPIVGLYGSTTSTGDTQKLSDEGKMEKRAGFSIRLPETLGGAAFDNMSVSPIEARDADGNTAYTYKEFFAAYADGDTAPFLSVFEKTYEGPQNLSEKTIVETRDIDGITVTYRTVPTTFLPPDDSIQPTEEERAEEARGERFISYGTDKRIDGLYHSISWEQDDLSYTIGCNDGSWETEDFFTAAEAVIHTTP